MKTLIIGILIALLGCNSVVANIDDDQNADIDQLKWRAFELEKEAHFGRIRDAHAEYYHNYYVHPYHIYPLPYAINPYAVNFPYMGNFPYVTHFYPHPMERTIVIPVPGANAIYSGHDINYSAYSERTEVVPSE